MTINEKAAVYFDRIKECSTHPEQCEKIRDIVEIVYIQAANETIASLLDELPEPVEMACSTKIAQIAYREKIKSLIQNKLK